MLVLWTTLLADILHKEEPVTPWISFYTLRQSTLNTPPKISVEILYCFPQSHRSFCLVPPNAEVCHPTVFVLFRRVKAEIKLFLYKP